MALQFLGHCPGFHQSLGGCDRRSVKGLGYPPAALTCLRRHVRCYGMLVGTHGQSE